MTVTQAPKLTVSCTTLTHQYRDDDKDKHEQLVAAARRTAAANVGLSNQSGLLAII